MFKNGNKIKFTRILVAGILSGILSIGVIILCSIHFTQMTYILGSFTPIITILLIYITHTSTEQHKTDVPPKKE